MCIQIYLGRGLGLTTTSNLNKMVPPISMIPKAHLLVTFHDVQAVAPDMFLIRSIRFSGDDMKISQVQWDLRNIGLNLCT
jgi:hypothetical protein